MLLRSSAGLRFGAWLKLDTFDSVLGEIEVVSVLVVSAAVVLLTVEPSVSDVKLVVETTNVVDCMVLVNRVVRV